MRIDERPPEGWYYKQDGRTIGPISTEQVKRIPQLWTYPAIEMYLVFMW